VQSDVGELVVEKGGHGEVESRRWGKSTSFSASVTSWDRRVVVGLGGRAGVGGPLWGCCEARRRREGWGW
jgi:hypothetical protein